MIRAVPKHVLDIKTQTILDDFGKYFREFPEVKAIEAEPFSLWFRSFAHPKLNEESQEFYRSIFRQIETPVSPELEAGLMQRLVAADTASKITELLERFNEGDEIDLGSVLRTTLEQFEQDTQRKVKTPWVRDDITDLLKDDQNDRGLHWRLDELNLSMRPLRSGDFGILAARPDVGKTTWCTDNVTYFAQQFKDVYPDEKRQILWFNNEGPGRRIKSRLYQSALNASISDLIARNDAGTLKQDYAEAVGGDEDIIRVFDIHDFWNHEVEEVIRSLNPGLILFDMVDNIRFGGAVGNNGQRTDQLLEAMYQWARVIGVKYDCPVLATSQVGADGENLCYPSLGMLKDSRTGKQGAADFILTIGYNSDFPSSRYLGLTKNKLAREGAPKSPKIECVMDGIRGRYVMPADFNGAT